MSNDLLVLFAAGNFLIALLTFIILLVKNIKK
ncbi:putative holin-like toxin [Clostridium botulinum]|nr:putative holin-like toxin [Clostridium botulinum]